MTHLNRLKIKNFQSLKDVEIDFSDRITTIVGKTDSGKSAILRALKSLCFNASGNDFITFGESKSLVEGGFGKDLLRWEKGEKVNRFISNFDGVEKVYDKVGKSVPEDIVSFLQIKDVEFDENKLRINFSDQFDPPFLLWESGVKASKILGKLTNLDSIYESLGACSRDIKRLKSDNKFNDDLILEKESKLKDFEGVDEEKQRLQKIRDVLDAINADISKYNAVVDIQKTIESLKAYKKVRQELLSKQKGEFIDVSLLKDRMNKYLTIKELKGGLISLKNKRGVLKEKHSEALSNVSFYEKALASLRDKIEICPLCKTNLKKCL